MDSKMQNIVDMINSLRKKHVELWNDNGRLHYRAPKGTLAPEEITLLHQHKQYVIECLSVQQASHGQLAFNSKNLAPLAFHQEFFWNTSQHTTSLLNLVSALFIHGELVIDALECSVQALVQRHAALRTQIVLEDGIPKQCVCDQPNLKLEVVDICSSMTDDAHNVAQRHIDEFAKRKLDLTLDSLFKVRLVKMANQDYLLVFSMHHIVGDAFSIGIIHRDLWYTYANLVSGRKSFLPPLAMQYADYARQQWRTYPNWLRVHEDFWKRRLAAALRVRLPYDDDLKHIPSFSPAERVFSLDKALSFALRELAREERCLFPVLMLAAYSVLVRYWCKQNDFVIPFNFFGRDRQEYRDIVGLFVYPLLLRIELTGNETYSELFKNISREFILACKHADFGRWLNEAPHLLEGSCLQCLTVGKEDAQRGIQIGRQKDGIRLKLEQYPINVNFSENEKIFSDIGLTFLDNGSAISVRVIYRADLFKPNTIERFCKGLRDICFQMAKNSHDSFSSYNASSSKSDI